jgi:signal transduction histidine kinase
MDLWVLITITIALLAGSAAVITTSVKRYKRARLQAQRDQAEHEIENARLDKIRESLEASSTNLMQVTESLVNIYKFSHPKTQWNFHNHGTSDDLIVAVPSAQLETVISELVNKSLEKTGGTEEAVIDLTLMERPDYFILQIMNNGPIVPPLNLVDIRAVVESLGGQLQIREREAVGTQVILLLPKKVKTLAHAKSL